MTHPECARKPSSAAPRETRLTLQSLSPTRRRRRVEGAVRRRPRSAARQQRSRRAISSTRKEERLAARSEQTKSRAARNWRPAGEGGAGQASKGGLTSSRKRGASTRTRSILRSVRIRSLGACARRLAGAPAHEPFFDGFRRDRHRRTRRRPRPRARMKPGVWRAGDRSRFRAVSASA